MDTLWRAPSRGPVKKPLAEDEKAHDPRLKRSGACGTNRSVEKAAGIALDSFVTISYSIFPDGESAPMDLGENETRTTLSYVHGYGLALPALEKGLEGEAKGTQLTVEAEPAEAFGPHESDGVFEVGKEDFEDAATLKVGDELMAEGPDGEMIMRVVEIRDDSFVVDTNHPLAGKKVRFDIEIVDVRPATDEEIADAQDEAEDLAADDACCGHDHSQDGGHSHSHGGHTHSHGPGGHTHDDAGGDSLVQLSKKAPEKGP